MEGEFQSCYKTSSNAIKEKRPTSELKGVGRTLPSSRPDLEFVKKFTRPNFRAKKFYTLKMRKWRLFSPAINSENASLSVIWASFG